MTENKKNILSQFSNYNTAKKNAREYLGDDVKLLISPRKNKKYRVYAPDGNPVDFGQMGYEDYTMHGDEKRRDRYLKRATNIKGKWRDDPYSPNMLSLKILWDY